MKILYADKDILICVKPVGALSTDEPGGMPELLREVLQEEAAEVRTVHRLDRVVGGLMVFARSQAAASSLSRQITDKSFWKEYLAVLHGVPKEKEGLLEDLLFRDSTENKTYVVKRMRKGVREAALEYSVLEEKKGLSLVRIHLLTGRTHQIRAQFSSRSMPLVGDRKYGAAEDNCEIALWSSRLCFKHPRSGKEMDFSLEPPGGFPWSLFGFSGDPVPSVRDHTPCEAVHEPEKLCSYAEKCGGCQLMGLPYREQLRKKQEKLNALLGEFGSVMPIVGMEMPYHYRNKSQAAFGIDEKGKIISGTYQQASHRIIPVESCLIEDPIADEIVADIRTMMPKFKITAYNERKEQGFLRHVLVKRGFSTGEVMVVLVASQPVFKTEKPFVKALVEKHPEIKTVILNVNSAYTSVVLGRKEKVLYGPGYIEDILCSCRFRISAKSFYQINAVQTEKLYSIAIDFANLTGKERVLDAYCGTGTIGIVAATKCASVTGVEINKDAVRDAIINARTNNRKNCWFICGDAGEYMENMAEAHEKCDVVFMDPPRSGSDEKFLSSLIKMSPKRVVYISCGPDSLARDLKILTSGGYTVQKIQPVDMFPHTEHVETVCLLSKLSEAKHHISVQVDMDELDLTAAESKATYEEIQEWVQEKYGFHVTHLNIAKTKRKCGIIERQNYNLPKSENSRSPETPKEKEEAIIDAFLHFKMM